MKKIDNKNLPEILKQYNSQYSHFLMVQLRYNTLRQTQRNSNTRVSFLFAETECMLCILIAIAIYSNCIRRFPECQPFPLRNIFALPNIDESRSLCQQGHC